MECLQVNLCQKQCGVCVIQFAELHWSAVSVLLSLAVFMWSCIPSREAYVSPLEPSVIL